MSRKSDISVRPGRPREFDTEGALDRAITRFSEYGYHGTSISDLNACLGLTSGDKPGLFLAALDRYMLLRGEAISACLAGENTGREKIEALLKHYAWLSGEAVGRTGCLVIETAVELALADAEVAALIAAQQHRREVQLLRLIEDAQRDGSVRSDLNAAMFAKMLLALQQGMRVLGKTGVRDEDMQGVVAELMRLLE
jgi:AcrR family transcriptional regulator